MSTEEEQFAIAELRRAARALRVASRHLGEHAGSEAHHFARRIEDLIPLAEKELRGEKFVCRCCGMESFRPFGLFDETLCGPCYNGIHHGHEPAPEVAREHEKRWGRSSKSLDLFTGR